MTSLPSLKPLVVLPSFLSSSHPTDIKAYVKILFSPSFLIAQELLSFFTFLEPFLPCPHQSLCVRVCMCVTPASPLASFVSAEVGEASASGPGVSVRAVALARALDPETKRTHSDDAGQCPGCKQPIPGETAVFLSPVSHPSCLVSLVLCHYTTWKFPTSPAVPSLSHELLSVAC